MQSTFNNINKQEIKDISNKATRVTTARPRLMDKTRPSTACMTLTQRTISRENKRRGSAKNLSLLSKGNIEIIFK